MKVFANVNTLIFFLIISPYTVLAQGISNEDRAPSEPNVIQNQGSPETMWALQFAYDAQDTLSGASGLAGTVHFNNEFWVSQWNTDSLFRLNMNGQVIERFTIPGLSSTRSITYDGTYLWMGNATTTIYKVDPTTKTVINTLSTPENARFLTYDSTASEGDGGFWLGNWATDIYQIDTSGNVLDTILASVHGLTGMYGAAVDVISDNGPYLWIHWQNGFSSESEIAQLSLPSGLPTGVSFDVTSVAGAPNGLAGGLFISNNIIPGQMTIGGMIQRSPNTLFGLELDFQAINYDANVSSISQNSQYHQIPLGRSVGTFSIAPSLFTTEIINTGKQTSDIQVDLWLELNGNVIASDTVILPSVTSLGTQSIPFDGFTLPDIGTYTFYVKAVTIGNTDEVPNNNQASYTFQITDSTLARDNGLVLINPYILNVNNNQASEIGVLYSFNQSVTITSLEIELIDPSNSMFTFATIYDIDPSTGLPNNVIAQSNVVVTTSANQFIYTLPFENPIDLPAGNYIVSVYQPNGQNLGLGQSSNIFTANTNFYNIGGNWNPSGVATSRMIRIHLNNRGYATSAQSIHDLNDQISLFPNPTGGQFQLKLDLDGIQNLNIDVINNAGQIIQNHTFNKVQTEILSINLTPFPNGIYYLKIDNGQSISTKRILKMGN